jgi:Gas vesicle synthesis protein GvpL/GvpF
MRKRKLAVSKSREIRVTNVPAVQRGDHDREIHAVALEPAVRAGIARAPDAPRIVPAQAAAQQEGRYVYGVIETREPLNFGRIGIGGAGEMVYTVQHGDIAAIVSKTAVFIFDPTRENALAHEHVIETVMKSHTIIPMSFGTVFRTDDDIHEVLKSIYPSLKDVLKQMEGKLEFGLKVTWDRDRVIEELKSEDEEIRRFQQEITRKHLQSTYFARMQLGRMIDKSLVERSAQYVREIYDALRSVCVASRDNKPIGDKMIMNAAFLIQREREGDFDAAVNKIARRYGERLNFKYTGPWPPYNFVNIRLKLERGTGS